MPLYSTQLLKTPATHSKSISRGIDSFWAYLTENLVKVTWDPICRIARDEILSLLEKISIGELKVITPTQTWDFGLYSPAHPNLRAVLQVRSDAFWTRIALFTDLGLAEAFMYGDVDCEDMSALLKILILNREHLGTIESLAASILSIGRSLTTYKFKGYLTNSRANISSHYDLGNTMFRAFLSEDMNYSCALFRDYNEDLNPGSRTIETLEDAQMRKMRSILKKVNIQPGDRVLEIGTGFGSLSILAAQTVDCTITTVTLSVHQSELARSRIASAGLQDRITVYNMDFRECIQYPEWAGSFDRFISIEMIENIGKDFIAEYWRVVDWALKKTSAIGVAQVISMPEARIPNYDRGADFIQKWLRPSARGYKIFPGVYIPSLQFLLETMTDGSSGRLTVDSVYNIGPHYARTLREWKRKFILNWDNVIAPALIGEYDLGPDSLEVFRRKWIYYFDYCESGFATRTLGDHCITFTREGNTDFGCDFDVEA